MRFGQQFYRFVPEARWEEAVTAVGLESLKMTSSMSEQERRRRGEERLGNILDYACSQVAGYGYLSDILVREQGLFAFPFLTKQHYGDCAKWLAYRPDRMRWNRTTGSTNIPFSSPLDPTHEPNQILRWLRHWRSFGIDASTTTQYLVPRSYRLRSPGGEPLRDLAGGHRVVQNHIGERPGDVEPVVIANPHVLQSIFPKGWSHCPKLLVNSYEQRPADRWRWPAEALGDVWGLSEVGDCAWRGGDTTWQVHDDMVVLELRSVSVTAGTVVVGELVVTDLVNLVMPLVRYCTGDLGLGLVRPDGRLERLLGVAGRTVATGNTCVQDLDIMSVLRPLLIDYGRKFEFYADRASVYLVLPDATYGERAVFRRRLERYVPRALVVGEKPDSADNLQCVFQFPDIDSLTKALE